MLDIYQKLNSLTKHISILYVEDDKETRAQYESIFKLLFKKVKCAENGKVALELYNKKRYDLLITDLTMPHMDGISLISSILTINPAQHTIIMTAHDTSEYLKDSIDFQIDGILLKPVTMEKLVQLLYKVSNLIEIEKSNTKYKKENKKLGNLLKNQEQALFLVVIDRFNDILEQFGSEIKDFIFDAVREHLSYFGIEKKHTLELHNDVIICSTDKKYLDGILEALQDFSNSHNTLIVEFNHLKIYITLSYGVIILKEDKTLINTNNTFVHHINSIVNEIKDDEHSTFVVKMDVDIEEAKKSDSLSWLGITLDALKKESIVPFYQEIVDINTMQTNSYEVFSRIKHGNKYILPKFFIDLSEKAGILEDISEVVFKHSFEELSATDYPFHINISNSQWKNNDIEDYLIYLNSHYKIPNERVIIDIRNYESIKPSSNTMKSLLRLKKMGYKFSIMGFGTGSINIELLSILKPEYIKISQILLQKSLTDSNMKSTLSFLLEYTRNANIKSILVGIESENILNEGRELGFDYAQGYFIKQPSDKL